MLLGPFRVRLADAKSEEGFKRGLAGTVIGQDVKPPQKQGQGPRPFYYVIWTKYDEETGNEAPHPKLPTPSPHFPEDLRAFVDEFEEDDDTPQVRSSTESRQSPEVNA